MCLQTFTYYYRIYMIEESIYSTQFGYVNHLPRKQLKRAARLISSRLNVSNWRSFRCCSLWLLNTMMQTVLAVVGFGTAKGIIKICITLSQTVESMLRASFFPIKKLEVILI